MGNSNKAKRWETSDNHKIHNQTSKIKLTENGGKLQRVLYTFVFSTKCIPTFTINY